MSISKRRSKQQQTEHFDIVKLFEKIAKLLPYATTFNEVVVRSAVTRYANEADFLSGSGAAMVGGRWNPKGILAVYASLDVITATYEAYQGFIDAGFTSADIRPRVIAGLKAKLNTICDLTASDNRRKLGFSLNFLLTEDWQAIQATGKDSWTQAIGRGCQTAGFEALLVPSARNRTGKNIVIFPGSLRLGSSLTPLAAHELPPHPTDWPS